MFLYFENQCPILAPSLVFFSLFLFKTCDSVLWLYHWWLSNKKGSKCCEALVLLNVIKNQKFSIIIFSSIFHIKSWLGFKEWGWGILEFDVLFVLGWMWSLMWFFSCIHGCWSRLAYTLVGKSDVCLLYCTSLCRFKLSHCDLVIDWCGSSMFPCIWFC